MAYLEVSAFKKLRAFFWGLQNSSFKLNRIPAKDNEGTPINKAYCLNLLHSFPDFQGEQFKDDNFLVKYLSKPGNIKQILDQFTPAQQIELTKVFEEKPVAVEAVSEQPSGQAASAGQEEPLPAGESTSMAGGVPFPGIAGGTAAATAPRRVIRIVPRVEKELPLEKRVPGLKNTPETGLDYEGKPYESDAEYRKTSGAKTAGRRFQTPRIPTGLANFGKNFASRAGIFLNRNIIPIARTGLGVFAGGVLTGGNPLAMLGGGIGGATFNAWGRKVLNGSINAGVGISNQVSRGSLVKGASKKWIALLFVGMFGFVFLTGFIIPPGGGPTTGGETGGGTGGGGNIASCRFTRSGSANPVRSSTLQGWITNVANSQGVPAAVLASIAMHENPTLLAKDDNDPTIQSGQFCVDGPAVCVDRSRNVTAHSGACTPSDPAGWQTATAKGLMQLLDIYNVGFPFCDIQANIQKGAEILKGKMGSGSWNNENDVKKAVCRFFGIDDTSCPYSQGSPYDYGAEAWRDYQNCRPPTPTPGTSAVASCPVPGGTISTASYTADPIRGHCSPGYRGCLAECRTTGRRAKAIDVRTEGKDVVLPKLQGQTVQWTLINPTYSITADDGGGWGYTFRTTYSRETWYIDMLHLLPSSTVVKDGIYPSGHVIGKVDAGALARVGSEPHVHTTIGKNLTTPVSPGSQSTDCDSGWLASDFMCQ